MRKTLIAVMLLAGLLAVAQTAKRSATKTGKSAAAAAPVIVTPDTITWADARPRCQPERSWLYYQETRTPLDILQCA